MYVLIINQHKNLIKAFENYKYKKQKRMIKNKSIWLIVKFVMIMKRFNSNLEKKYIFYIKASLNWVTQCFNEANQKSAIMFLKPFILKNVGLDILIAKMVKLYFRFYNTKRVFCDKIKTKNCKPELLANYWEQILSKVRF